MALRLQSTWRLLVFLILVLPAAAQTPPSPAELQAYRGLHAAAAVHAVTKSGSDSAGDG